MGHYFLDTPRVNVSDNVRWIKSFVFYKYKGAVSVARWPFDPGPFFEFGPKIGRK